MGRCWALVVIAVGLVAVAACDKNGSDEATDAPDPIVGAWVAEQGGESIVLTEDGQVTAGADEGRNRACREAGFGDAVEECAAGHWERTEGGSYRLQLPAMDVREEQVDGLDVEPGAEPRIVECRCGGMEAFPAELDGDTLRVDFSRVGGPEIALRRR